MANLKINITHPSLYKVTDAGKPAELFKTGEQEVEEKLAKKLLARGVASLTDTDLLKLEVEAKKK